MRSPAHSLSKGFLQIRHARVFTWVSCSISKSWWAVSANFFTWVSCSISESWWAVSANYGDLRAKVGVGVAAFDVGGFAEWWARPDAFDGPAHHS